VSEAATSPHRSLTFKVRFSHTNRYRGISYESVRPSPMAKSVYARLKEIKSAVMLPIEILNRRRAPFESDSDSTVRLLVCESDRFALRPGAPVRAEVREETTNGA